MKRNVSSAVIWMDHGVGMLYRTKMEKTASNVMRAVQRYSN